MTDLEPAHDREDGRQLIINEVQLILAEKRTSLSTLRTGIAVLVLPLSVLSILVTMSKYYHFRSNLVFLAPLLTLCVFLAALGLYLIIRAVNHLHHQDRLVRRIKQEHSSIRELLD